MIDSDAWFLRRASDTLRVRQAADKWDRSHDTIVNSFTMSIQNVADRVYWAGTNDSFVKGFWELRVNVSQVITEMAAQTLMLNIGARALSRVRRRRAA